MNSGGASSLSKESCSGLRDMIDCKSSDSEVSEKSYEGERRGREASAILFERSRATADRATTPLVKGGVSVTPCLLSVPSNLLSNRRPTSKNWLINWVRSGDLAGPESCLDVGDIFGFENSGFPISSRDIDDRELGRLITLLCVGSSPMSYVVLNDARRLGVGATPFVIGEWSWSTVRLWVTSAVY